MKTIFRLLPILLLCILLMAVAVSCGGGNPAPAETTDSQNASSDPEQTTDGTGVGELPSEQLSQYVIVYPEFETGLSDGLHQLRETYIARFRVAPEISDDFYRAGTVFEIKPYEILVGNTNREESLAVYGTLERAQDYAIRVIGNKIVVAGRTTAATVQALEQLIGQIGDPERDLSAFPAGITDVTFVGNYELDGVTLCGNDITGYSVVYEDNSLCKGIADGIAYWVRQRSGLVLEPVSARKKHPETGCILIGNTGKTPSVAGSGMDLSTDVYLGFEDGNFYLYGTDSRTVWNSWNELENLFRYAEGPIAAIDPEAAVRTYPDQTLTTMSFNIYHSTSDTARMENVVSTIRKHRPDTFGVQEATPAWMTYLKNVFGDEYACVGEGRNGGNKGEYSAVFYRKDRFELLDSGTRWLSETPDQAGSQMPGAAYPRILTYALLWDKVTEKQFLHVNTHTDHVPDKNVDGQMVRLRQAQVITAFLQETFPDVPTILSGDLNDTITSPELQHLLSSGFVNCGSSAIKRSTDPTFGSSIIDFLLCRNQGEFLVYDYFVDTERYDGEFPSDHRAILIRYDLN